MPSRRRPFQVETKKKLTDSEEEGGCNSTLEHIAPVNLLFRYVLEDQGNENGDPDERDKQVKRRKEPFWRG